MKPHARQAGRGAGAGAGAGEQCRDGIGLNRTTIGPDEQKSRLSLSLGQPTGAVRPSGNAAEETSIEKPASDTTPQASGGAPAREGPACPATSTATRGAPRRLRGAPARSSSLGDPVGASIRGPFVSLSRTADSCNWLIARRGAPG